VTDLGVPPHEAVGEPAVAPPRVQIYGLWVSSLDFRHTVLWLLDRAKRRIPTNVACLNAGKVAAMRSDPSLARAMGEADLVLPDGQSIVWASRFLSRPVRERVAGIDVMTASLAEAGKHGMTAYFLGATEEVLHLAVEAASTSYGSRIIAGAHHGYFGLGEEAEVVEGIQRSGADFLYVAMSTPRKEIWVSQHMAALGVPVVIGVGGALDVLAGVTRRAPRFIQVAGAEWLYRFAQEPARMWRRYLIGNAVFLWLTLKEAVVPTSGHH
jgi:N-acetylglucosaminyldiphosphoundecaprenol N-acetyl-beta-D-mannosaminyltransferase